MSKKNYGIRPQLYDKKKNKLVDDFMYDIEENFHREDKLFLQLGLLAG